MPKKKAFNKIISIFLLITTFLVSSDLSGFAREAQAAGTPPQLITPEIDSSSSNTLLLASNGTVWELTDLKGDRVHENYPAMEIKGLNGFKEVIAPKYALKNDGTLWSWDSSRTFQVEGLSNIKDISTEDSFSVALDNDGNVFAWGQNHWGYLGVGDTAVHDGVLQVSALSDITAIATGLAHSLALKSDGTVWAWGSNYNGALGIGSAEYKSVPTQVPGISDAVYIGAGDNQSFVIKRDGTALAWGRNDFGQLGDGTKIDRNTPVQVKNLSGLTVIHGGRDHVIALKSDGTVWSWGSNDLYQLGNGTDIPYSYTPVQVTGLTNVVDIEAEFYTNKALTGDGKLWSWGSGSGGAHGDGLTARRNIPFQSPVDTSPSPIRITSANVPQKHVIFYDYDTGPSYQEILINFSEFLDKDTVNMDNVYLLDDQGHKLTENYYVGVTDLYRSKTIRILPQFLIPGEKYTLKVENIKDILGFKLETPYQVEIEVKIGPNTNNYAKTLSAGGFHSLGQRGDIYAPEKIYAWGDNTFGQLGDGTTIDRPAPVEVKGLSNVTQLSAGGFHSLALKNGEVWAWGNNEYGQLGNDSGKDSLLPIKIANLSDIVEISAGDSHNLALRADGTVWAWGANLSGQLGDGTFIHRFTPVRIENLENIIAISAGGEHNLAIRYDGTVWAWGRNDNGQLGDGSQENRLTPVQIPNLTEVKKISAGWAHSMALKQNNTILTWGDNSLGQLGIGSHKSLSTVPEALSMKGDSIEAGYFSSLAIASDAWDVNLYSWGQDYFQKNMQDPTSTGIKYTPEPVYLQANAISAGGGHSIIFGESLGYNYENRYSGNGLWGWGLNFSGQLGMGHTQHVSIPQFTEMAKLSDKGHPNYFRLAGTNRIETALITSQAGWSYGSQYVILTRSDAFPDALAGAPLAHALGAPILLTNSQNLSAETEEELTRLSPQQVIILGSEGAVSRSIENKLQASAKVTRIGGNDRFETAATIARFMLDNDLYTSNKAVVAYGLDFPDALSVSSIAAYQNMPILLTAKNSLPAPTAAALKELGVQETIVVGGENVISKDVALKLPRMKRLAGARRSPSPKGSAPTPIRFLWPQGTTFLML